MEQMKTALQAAKDAAKQVVRLRQAEDRHGAEADRDGDQREDAVGTRTTAEQGKFKWLRTVS